MSAEQNAAASRRLVEEGWNGPDLSVIREIIHPDAVYHDPAIPEGPRDLTGIRHFVGVYRSAFPDAHLTIEDMVSQGDKVVWRWTARGTHRGWLLGLAPTGRAVTITGVTVDRYEDGQIVEAWGHWDTLGLLRQIGAAPGEGRIGSPPGGGRWGQRAGVFAQRLAARRLRRRSGLQNKPGGPS
jgi:steroid delta-isomerase-like uncharacterized protein